MDGDKSDQKGQKGHFKKEGRRGGAGQMRTRKWRGHGARRGEADILWHTILGTKTGVSAEEQRPKGKNRTILVIGDDAIKLI